MKSALRGAVRKTTQAQYARSGDMWDAFLQEHECTERYLVGMEREMQRAAVVLFVTWLKDKGVAVTNTMAGLFHEFRSELQDTTIFRDPAVEAARKSVALKGRALSLAQEKRYRYPISFDMVSWLREQTWLEADIDGMMTSLGITYAFNHLKRASEYAWSTETKYEHTLMNEDVLFEFGGSKVKKAPWELVPSDSRRELVNVTAIDRSSKANSKGRGRLENISSRSEEEGQFMRDMLWFALTKESNQEGEMFFSRVKGGRSKKLTRKMVSTALKRVAREFDLPEEHFSSHCCRIGGATELIHQGEGDEVQRRIGGWSSKASLVYPERTLANGGVLSRSTQRQRVSVEDVHRMRLRKGGSA